MPTVPRTPYISVNKLAEFVTTSNSSRRKRIVADAKKPMNFITTRYTELRRDINSFVLSKDPEILQKSLEKFKAKSPVTDFDIQEKKLALEVLKILKSTPFDLPDGLEIKRPKFDRKDIVIGGVKIGINPDLEVFTHKRGQIQRGIIKLHIVKTFKLTQEAQEVVGAILHHFLNDYIDDYVEDGTAEKKLCFSLDAFSGAVQCCPNGTVRIMQRVTDSCEEIKNWWATL